MSVPPISLSSLHLLVAAFNLTQNASTIQRLTRSVLPLDRISYQLGCIPDSEGAWWDSLTDLYPRVARCVYTFLPQKSHQIHLGLRVFAHVPYVEYISCFSIHCEGHLLTHGLPYSGPRLSSSRFARMLRTQQIFYRAA